jgi:LuxR family transcriptional regulator, maltose regulon positive regulatory protein
VSPVLRGGSAVVVCTRLRPPPPHAQELRRPRLLSQLDSMSAPVVLLNAPHGCGKTVLLAQWIRLHRDTRWCWLSVSKHDPPASFWPSLAAALSPLHPALPGLQGSNLSDRTTLLDDVVPNLVNDLAAADPLTIVIDGVDPIADPLTAESLELFIHWLPDSARLVLSTARPARTMATFRASGKLGELSEADLRFTDDEACRLLNAVSGRSLSREEAASINSHIDGWAIGVRLTALAMAAGDPYPEQLVSAVADYARAEVLSRMTPNERLFLAHTSVIPELTVQACAALVGPEAEELLTGLAESTLFVRRRKPGSYELHPVLRTILRTGLLSQQPELARELNERAARWSLRHRIGGDTVRYAMAAHRRDIAIAAILERWPSARPDEVLGWLDAVRTDTEPDRRLRRIKAAAELANGDTAAAWRTVTADDPADAGLRALLRLRRGSLTDAGRDAVTATAATVRSEPWCMPIGQLALGSVWLWQGRPADAYAELIAAAGKARSIGYTFALVRALDAASVCMALLDHTREASALATEAIQADGDAAVLAYAVLALYGNRWPRVAPSADTTSMLAIDEPHQHAYRWWVAAELAQARGDRNASRSARAKGRSLLSDAEPGATLACLLRPEPPSAARPDCGNPITEREHVVLRALRGPLTLREIADELRLSHNTVKSHTQAVFRKLGTHSRRETVTAAEELGLLPKLAHHQ